MDFTRKTRQRIERKPEIENLDNLYAHNVMLYHLPPLQDISIQEFEDLALERLKVLRIFEQSSSKNLRFGSDEWKDSITAELNREGLKGYVRLLQPGTGTKKESDLQARRRDYISHFILRLAYCRSQDLKRWFVSREMELFRMKFAALGGKDIKHFLEINKLDYAPLTEEQKDEVVDGLYESTMGTSSTKVSILDYYKVHFTEVLDLVKGRKCYLKNGFAYVNTNDFVSIVAAKQQIEIEKGLQSAQRLLPEIENDERLFHLLKGLHTSYTGKDYTLSKGSEVPIESIDQLSKKSFPLCMRMCHETLRTKHHHKHGGRMQYGLFLKGIGVTLEDALRFWREEFTKMMDLEKFEKRYSYNIRHNYGREGSMINYTPHSCIKIITSSVGPLDTHGCPFKMFDPVALKVKLGNYGLSAAHVQEVVNYCSKGHYQIACSKYFEITHEIKIEEGINHPNKYFELSQTVMGNREPKKGGGVANSSNNTPGGKKGKTLLKDGNNDATLLDVEDDDELWNIAETQETDIAGTSTVMNTSKKSDRQEWGEDEFDVTQVENMDY